MRIPGQKGVYMRKHLAALRPDNSEAAELINKIKLNDVVLVEIRKPRNLAHHRKFFAMLQVVLSNTEKYSNLDDLLEDFKIAIGEFDWVERQVNGKVYEVPKGRSISFARMKQDDFDIFYDRAINSVITDVIPGLDRVELEKELLEFA